MMRRKLLPLILGGMISIAAVAPTAAQTSCGVTQQGRGGAAAFASLISAAVNATVPVGVNACDIDINVLNNSLNNLLQNADIHVLENILNNSPILSGFDITVTDVLNGVQVNVLSGGVQISQITIAP